MSAGLWIEAGEPASEVKGVPEAPESWIGRSLDELKVFWGDPVKVKLEADGSKFYRFQQKMYVIELVNTPGYSFADAGVGPSSPTEPGKSGGSGTTGSYTKSIGKDGKSSVSTGPSGDPFDPLVAGGVDMNERPVAKRKAKFWVDPEGNVIAEEIGELKWKKGYGPKD